MDEHHVLKRLRLEKETVVLDKMKTSVGAGKGLNDSYKRDMMERDLLSELLLMLWGDDLNEELDEETFDKIICGLQGIQARQKTYVEKEV